MEAQEIKESLAEQGKRYLIQLKEEGEPFFEEAKRLAEEWKQNFYKKLFEQDENDK